MHKSMLKFPDWWQAVLVEVDDDDVALEEPLYQCQACRATRVDPPEVTGRLQLELRNGGSSLQAFASKNLVTTIAGGWEPAKWGAVDSEQRLSLRNQLSRWEGQEYMAAINTAPTKTGLAFYVSHLSQPSAKKARV